MDDLECVTWEKMKKCFGSMEGVYKSGWRDIEIVVEYSYIEGDVMSYEYRIFWIYEFFEFSHDLFSRRRISKFIYIEAGQVGNYMS